MLSPASHDPWTKPRQAQTDAVLESQARAQRESRRLASAMRKLADNQTAMGIQEHGSRLGNLARRFCLANREYERHTALVKRRVLRGARYTDGAPRGCHAADLR